MNKIQLHLSSNFLLIQVVNTKISRVLRTESLPQCKPYYLTNQPTPSACTTNQPKKLDNTLYPYIQSHSLR